MVRKAKLSDLIDICSIVKKDSSRYEFPFKIDTEFVFSSLYDLMVNNNIDIFVQEDNNEIVGAIAIICHKDIFSGKLIANELFWYVDEGHNGMALFNAFEQFCKERGVNIIMVSTYNNKYNSILDKLYRRKNYKLLNSVYYKEV